MEILLHIGAKYRHNSDTTNTKRGPDWDRSLHPWQGLGAADFGLGGATTVVTGRTSRRRGASDHTGLHVELHTSRAKFIMPT